MLPEQIRSAQSRSRQASPKTARLAVRVSASQKTLLDEASRLTDTTLSDFVLSAATQAAQDVLADRNRFVVPRRQWDRFVRALDAPPRTLPRLRRLLESPGVLDEA
jgi:uncharacterized protein (DUF1778 family)